MSGPAIASSQYRVWAVSASPVGSRLAQINDLRHRRQRAQDSFQFRPAIDGLAAVVIAVDAEHELRRQLAKPVHDAARPEIRTTAGPNGADAHRRQHGDDGLGRVGQIGGDSIAAVHSEGPHVHRKPAHSRAEIGPAQCVQAAPFAQEQQSVRTAALMAQCMLCIIQQRAGEPLRAGHIAPAEDPLVRLGGLNSEIVPKRAPEAIQVIDRPLPQCRVGIEAPAARRKPTKIMRQMRPLDALRARSPQQVAFLNRIRHTHLSLNFAGTDSAADIVCLPQRQRHNGEGRIGGAAGGEHAAVRNE